MAPASCVRCLADLSHRGDCLRGCPMCGGTAQSRERNAVFADVKCDDCGVVIERRVVASWKAVSA